MMEWIEVHFNAELDCHNWRVWLNKSLLMGILISDMMPMPHVIIINDGLVFLWDLEVIYQWLTFGKSIAYGSKCLNV